MDWPVFFSVLSALVVFDACKGLPAFWRGLREGYKKARERQ